MPTIVEAPASAPAESAGREPSPRPAVIVLPLVPARADKEVCMFPKKCTWPTCSC